MFGMVGSEGTEEEDDTLDGRRTAFKATDMDKAEEERRDKQEEKERQKDKRKLKKLSAMNLPLAVKQFNDAQDGTAFTSRSRLSLPKPQVSDAELENIVKV